MVEEHALHNGYAVLLRELIDGGVGLYAHDVRPGGAACDAGIAWRNG